MNADLASRGLTRVLILNQYNLVWIGAAALLSLAFASPWPLAVAAAVEVVWVAFALQSHRAHRWAIRYLLEQDGARRAADLAPLLPGLEPAYRARVSRVEALADELRRLIWKRGQDGAIGTGKDNRLEYLVASFIRMAAMHQRLSGLVRHDTPEKLEEEILALGQSLSSEQDPRARYLLEQALPIAQRRLEQHQQIESQRHVIGIQMGTLEMSFEYWRTNLLSGAERLDLTAEVTQLLTNLSYWYDAEAQANESLADQTLVGALPQGGPAASGS